MSATMKATVHVGQYDHENLRTTRNMDFEKIKQLKVFFARNLIFDYSQEICVISQIDWNTLPRLRSTLLNDRAVKLSAKVCVFHDSLL